MAAEKGRRRLTSLVRRRWRLVPVLVVWAIAVAERTSHLRDWPTGFRTTLEFDSANAARTIFLELTPHSAAWERAWLNAGVGRFIEPPVLQTLTALTYLPGGVERPWTSIVFTVSAWLLGGAFLFSGLRRLTGWWGATLGLGFLLLAPFGVAVSQSFEPEALIVLALGVVFWYTAAGDILAGRRLWIAVLLGAFAALAKPGVLLPFIFAVDIAAAARGGPLRDPRRGGRLGALLILTALPTVAYAIIWMPGQVSDKVLPSVLLTPAFYAGWASNVTRVVGIIPLVGGALGFVLSPRLRRYGTFLGLAYLGYAAIFTWHTETHDYYQVPLMVVAAIGLGGLGEALASWAGGAAARAVAVAAAIAVAAALTFAAAPTNLLAPVPGRYPKACSSPRSEHHSARASGLSPTARTTACRSSTTES